MLSDTRADTATLAYAMLLGTTATLLLVGVVVMSLA